MSARSPTRARCRRRRWSRPGWAFRSCSAPMCCMATGPSSRSRSDRRPASISKPSTMPIASPRARRRRPASTGCLRRCSTSPAIRAGAASPKAAANRPGSGRGSPRPGSAVCRAKAWTPTIRWQPAPSIWVRTARSKAAATTRRSSSPSAPCARPICRPSGPPLRAAWPASWRPSTPMPASRASPMRRFWTACCAGSGAFPASSSAISGRSTSSWCTGSPAAGPKPQRWRLAPARTSTCRAGRTGASCRASCGRVPCPRRHWTGACAGCWR